MPERALSSAEASRERARKWYANNRERALSRLRERYHDTKQLKGRPFGEAHHQWAGDAVSYHALHIWVTRCKGSPSRCEHCGTDSAKRFEWANIDHKYARSLKDYIRLCTSCHRKYDYANGLSKKGGRRKVGA